jgi:hypothetical protein
MPDCNDEWAVLAYYRSARTRNPVDQMGLPLTVLQAALIEAGIESIFEAVPRVSADERVANSGPQAQLRVRCIDWDTAIGVASETLALRRQSAHRRSLRVAGFGLLSLGVLLLCFFVATFYAPTTGMYALCFPAYGIPMLLAGLLILRDSRKGRRR